MEDSASRIKFTGKPGMIPQALCRAKNISPQAKIVFAVLSTYNESRPGVRWIADHTPCSIMTARKCLLELELHGWTIREKRDASKGETDVYHLYFQSTIPVTKRPLWVQELGLTAEEIRDIKTTSAWKKVLPKTAKKQPKTARKNTKEVC